MSRNEGNEVDVGVWVAAASALIAVIALVFTGLQASSAKQQADAAREQVNLARRQTEVQERLYEDQQQPYVWVDYRLDPVSQWLVDLVIKNEGPTVARNVKVTFDPMVRRVERAKHDGLDSLTAFSEGFTSIPPGREMRWSLGTHVEVWDEKVLDTHLVTISFDGPFGHVGPYSYTLSYSDFKSQAIRERGSLTQMVEQLKKINLSLDGGVRAVQSLGKDDEL
jgi:type II secretory pathway pseudopilin PulG